MDTASIVKEKTVDILKDYDPHKERVLKVIGKSEGWKTSTQQQIADLKEKGFHCFVKRDMEEKFQYKAGINGSYILEDNHPLADSICLVGIILCIVITVFLGIVFTPWFGFIFPVLLIGLARLMVYFPESESKVINYVGDIPDKVIDNLEKAKECDVSKFMVYSCQPLPTEEVLVKVDPVMIGWLDDKETGVVIGIWDRDKEISI